MKVANLIVEEFDVQHDDVTDQQEGVVVSKVEMESGDGDLAT